MKLFKVELLLLNILQERCKRTDDAFWELERYKNAFEKVNEYYVRIEDLQKYIEKKGI